MTWNSLPTRVLRTGAWYDLAVTLPFATPWTASWIFDRMRDLHGALELGGAPPPSYEPTHMLFVNLLGIIVSLWALARLRRPSSENGAIDTLGRAGFALMMALALARGASHVVAVFLSLELSFMFVQAWAVWRMTHGATPVPQKQACSA